MTVPQRATHQADDSGESQKSVLLLGATGQLGSALVRAIGDSRPVRILGWRQVASDLPQFARLIERHPGADVVFATGQTNPQLGIDALRQANVVFPQSVIEAGLSAGAGRFMTLGTVMENFPRSCEVNPYLGSKLELGQWMESMARRPGLEHRFCHVRLHTIYGGGAEHIKPHMFLGQMSAALRSRTEFKMSSGDQLREYHHVDDVGAALAMSLSSRWSTGILEINHGSPVRLGDLARAIFREFGREDLLKIASIPRAEVENLDRVFPRSPRELLPNSRDAVSGVSQWIRTVLG